MKQYKPIATYSTAEDITNLFPCDAIKSDMADLVFKHYKEGHGNPHEYVEPDEESIWDENEVAEDSNFLLTKDGKHGVRFTRGVMERGIPYGFFIDIYELIEDDEDEVELTNEELKLISRERRELDAKIKLQIIKEFKARFKERGEGLDFYQYCGEVVYGMLDETGEIGKMLLDENGNIVVELGQEWEDPVVEFESRYFACDDWPQLLINVRNGIKGEWLLDESDYLEEPDDDED